MEVAPHLQPAGAIGLHPALEVARDAVPGVDVGGQLGVGLVAGLSTTDAVAVALDLEIPCAVARHRQAHAGTPARHVERVAVEALEEAGQSFGWSTHRCL